MKHITIYLLLLTPLFLFSQIQFEDKQEVLRFIKSN